MSEIPAHIVAGLDQRMAIAGRTIDQMVDGIVANKGGETEVECALAVFHAIRDASRTFDDPADTETFPIELAVVAMIKLARQQQTVPSENST